MSFVSLDYLGLFLFVFALHPWLPYRLRLGMVVAASYVFYAWGEPALALVLGVVTAANYLAALALSALRSPGARRAALLAAVLADMGTLLAFKVQAAAVPFAPLLEGSRSASLGAALPIGVSFYTFQALGYVIDVYRGQIRAERDPLLVAAFVAFFPQLVAGPIERAGDLIPQLRSPARVGLDDLVDGLGLVLAGLVKKLVISDRLFALSLPAFLAPQDRAWLGLATGLLLLPIALYLDFSAYTDVARGSGRLLGIRLSRNFAFPFASVSPSEFWRRWHVTLTRWVREYVFRPLGGARRRQPLRTGFNLVLCMSLVGLWHGLTWGFLIWGAGNGLALAGDYLLQRRGTRRGGALAAVAGWLLWGLYLLSLAPFFFCPTLEAVGQFWRGLLAGGDLDVEPWRAVLLAFLPAFFAVQVAGRNGHLTRLWERLPGPLRGLAVAALLYVVLFGALPAGRRFVYFQF